MTRTPDISIITALISEAADTLILPRFRRLRPEDIEDKSTSRDREDLVTTVDRDVERWLSNALVRVDPGALVLGEEAVHSTPDLMNLIASDAPLWIVDPIDGTRNFARGSDAFGVMVARVAGRHTLAAWILLPARGEMFVAEAGQGTWLNGQRLRASMAPSPPVPRGTVFTRYMPDALRARVERTATTHFDLMADSACAAVEYTDILRGRKDFAVYYRLLPWDHVPPALILTEAGGRVEHADGRTYDVRSAHQTTIVARSPEVAAIVRGRLTGRTV